MKRELLRRLSRAVRYREIEAVLLRPLLKYRRRGLLIRHVEHAVRKPLPPVLVYQMGKVASSSIADALQGRDDLNVIHTHFISRDVTNRVGDLLRRIGREREAGDMEAYAAAIRKHIIEPQRRAFVVTLVREPISRNISSYFHNLDGIWQTRDAYRVIPPDELTEHFLTRNSLADMSLEWFDREFRVVLGVDIYAHAFPCEQGYMRLSTERYEILIMRHDLDDRIKERCIRELLGVEDITVRRTNVAADKVYAEAYKRFLAAIRLPETYVAEMLDSKYARHFYTPEEIERLRRKWLCRDAPHTNS